MAGRTQFCKNPDVVREALISSEENPLHPVCISPIERRVCKERPRCPVVARSNLIWGTLAKVYHVSYRLQTLSTKIRRALEWLMLACYTYAPVHRSSRHAAFEQELDAGAAQAKIFNFKSLEYYYHA